MIRIVVHNFLHFFIPFIVAFIIYKKDTNQKIWKNWVILCSTMLVDLDHLFASPVFDPNRCSIGFHPMHSPLAIGIYALMSFLPSSFFIRLFGVGLLIHMGLDMTDCLFM